MNAGQVLLLAETAGTGLDWDVTKKVKGTLQYHRQIKTDRCWHDWKNNYVTKISFFFFDLAIEGLAPWSPTYRELPVH